MRSLASFHDEFARRMFRQHGFLGVAMDSSLEAKGDKLHTSCLLQVVKLNS